MFIRIIHTKKARGHESLYECLRYRTQPTDHGFIVTMEGVADTVSVDIDKRQTVEVYVMNNDGHTIDTLFQNRH